MENQDQTGGMMKKCMWDDGDSSLQCREYKTALMN